MSMHESPRLRRLRNDLAALERLRSDSSVFHFQATGNPPHHYQITFKGKGLWRDRGKVKVLHSHRIEIKLGTSYPRTIPEIRWLTPIYHPNISEIGLVCLGGYGTHWVPSVQLDELCNMLWDMARYHNYDIRSPYNRDAALWVANQTTILFPTDSRPLRDVRVERGRIDGTNGDGRAGESSAVRMPKSTEPQTALSRVRRLFERYGRSFTEVAAPEPDCASSNGNISASTSSTDAKVLPAALSTDSASPTTAPDVDRVDPAVASLQTLLELAGAPRREDEGVVILVEEVEPQRDQPLGEEILYIE
jgi:ubiquitin-protein ligase